MSDRVKIVPLGGVGEVGRNMLVVDSGDDLIVIDAGVMFPESGMLGVDLVIPDISYLLDKLDRLRGVIVTHGHEDHTGALPYVLPQLDFPPIYTSRLTAGLIQGKLQEHRLDDHVSVNTISGGDQISLGALTVEFFHVCHSIPDGLGLAIHTPVGLIVHSGDFKFDHTPINEGRTDVAKLADLGTQDVLCLLSDSTYADLPGYTPSERVVAATFERVFAAAPGRIIVTTFASLISRVQLVLNTAAHFDRKVCLVGRSMVQNCGIARDLGYLSVPAGILIDLEELDNYPPERLVLVSTGSQGEPTSALARMANRDHRQIEIVPGDTVVISATPIPGNEELVHRTVDNLFRLGANVLWSRSGHDGSGQRVHVSGHGSQEELKLMLSLIRPQYFIPIHGEYRHLVHHARIAESLGVPQSNIFVIEDGEVVEFGNGWAQLGKPVPAGYVFVDGLGVGDVGNVVLRDRRVLAQDGILVALITVDRHTGELVGRPDIVTRGFVYARESEDLMDEARQEIESVLAGTGDGAAADADWSTVKGKIQGVLRRLFYKRTRRRPMILPVVTEV